MSLNQRIPNVQKILSTAATVAATAMLVRSIAYDYIPNDIQRYLSSNLHNLYRLFSSRFTIVIEEFQGLSKNQMFDVAEVYLGTITSSSVQRVRVGKDENEKSLVVTLDRNEEVVDVFENIQMNWSLVCTQVEPSNCRNKNMSDLNATLRSEVRSYELSFHKRHKDKVLSSYLPYILRRAKSIRDESKTVKLHTVVEYRSCWDPNAVNLNHPMKFKTLAMDSELKKELMEDLNNFLNGKEYYKRIGKAWKRGYLLYGPPGTGKSSLIAAMANYLNFDIYDLDLSDVKSNTELRLLLLSMPSRSILVIEDIDCSIKLENRENENDHNTGNNKMTLSGLLNFIDGLWSCCGDERVIIFTTNYKEQLNPALLRPGRMDVHICMSYCTPSVFNHLALNHLGLCQSQSLSTDRKAYRGCKGHSCRSCRGADEKQRH
uniref:AAA+ ATPase domain-containing protein n=1 Tax=Quercus lobata TaxID=97700 RepID=A0A7N2LVW2_QUELO